MQRYDRQERLWTKQGQQSLSLGHVWAIGKSMAMLEALKNLALAGLGKLTLTMDAEPTNSFFDSDREPLTKQLKVMNADLQIACAEVPSSPVDVVIATVDRAPQVHLRDVPILVVGSHRMQGIIDLQYNGTKPIPILQPHPAAGLNDLRYRPEEVWPAYQAFCDSFDLDTLDETEHRHVPYCVLLVKALSQSSSRTTKEILEDLQKYPDEENFAEAKAQIWRLKAPAVPQGITDLIEFANSGTLTMDVLSTPFWMLVKALGRFIADHHCLPVTGHIPDMVSSSGDYVELKKIYKEKARVDAALLAGYARADPEGAGTDLSEMYVQTFCENSRFVKALVPQASQDVSYSDYIGNAGELAPVAALIGGIAGQEAMKLLMGQYTPLTGTLVYDGLTQQSKTVRETMRVIN